MHLDGRAASGRQLRFGLWHGGTGLQSREQMNIGPLPWPELQWIEPKRRPELVIPRKGEGVRHYADDGVKRPAELNPTPDDLRVGVETQPPDILPDDHDGQPTDLFVRRSQVAADERRRLRQVERRRGDLGNLDRFRCTFGATTLCSVVRKAPTRSSVVR